MNYSSLLVCKIARGKSINLLIPRQPPLGTLNRLSRRDCIAPDFVAMFVDAGSGRNLQRSESEAWMCF